MKAAALAVMCLVAVALASGPDTLWIRTLDKGFDESGSGIASRSNTLAAVGYFFGANYNDDWLVARLNQDGDTVWTRTYDGGADEDAVGTCIDARSNIFVTGRGYSYSEAGRRNPLRFRGGNRTRPVFGKSDVYFALTAKYDSLGELKWLRADTNHAATGIAVDSIGNGYVVGAHIVDTMNWDTWLAKISPLGDTIWSKTFNFAQFEVGYGPALDASGNIAMAIYAGDSLGFDCLALMLAADGHVIWSARYDRGPNDACSGVAIDHRDNVILAGSITRDTLSDALVLKYDSAGTLVWDKVYDFDTYDEMIGAACDSAGDIYAAGDASPDYYTSYCLTVKLDSMGDTLWTARYDEQYSGAYGIALDPTGDPVIVGTTTMADMDLLMIKYSALTGIAESPLPTPAHARAHAIITAGPDFVLSVPCTGRYDVRLCDLTGRCREVLYSGNLSSGAHRLSLAGQPAGNYVVRVTAPAGAISCQRLALVR